MKEISPWRIQRTVEVENGKSDYIDAQYVRIPESEETHLRDYWKIVVKRRRLVVLVFLIMLALGAYFNFSATPLYTASTTIKIEPQNPKVTGIMELLSSNARGGGKYDYYQTQFAIAESAPLAAKVITKLGLESTPIFKGVRPTSGNPLSRVSSWLFGFINSSVNYISGIYKSWVDAPEHQKELPPITKFKLGVPPYLIGRYLNFLEVKPVRNTRLLNVLFTTPVPQMSQELANAHSTAFLRMDLESSVSLTQEAREFLQKKRAELQAKVERSERALNRFRRKHGVVSLEKGENIIVNRMIDLNRQLTRARTQRIETESLYRMVKNKNPEYLSQVINHSLIQRLKGTVAALQAEQARLSTIFKPDHPRRHELRQQIREVRLNLNNEIATVVRGIETNYAAARAKEEALQVDTKRQQEKALGLKELGVDYTLLSEQVKINRTLYKNVLRRLSETFISNDIAVSNMQITQPAEIPLRPSSPKTSRNLLLAASFGLFFGVGLAFFLEYLDTSVGTPEDVWRAVSLNTLGVVPDLRSLGRRLYAPSAQHKHDPVGRQAHPRVEGGRSLSKELIVSQHPLSIIAESYRTIRTALLLSQAEKPPQMILLTSPGPGDGKTMTALNLGITLAQGGHSVVVIDADLRKGRCHRLLGLQNHKGLANILTGNLTLEEGVQKTVLDGLSLLSRGVLPPNPADLVGSRKMKEVSDALRESFNFILIDSPPVNAVTDATVLSLLCDGVLLVLNGQKSKVAATRKAIEHLEAVRARLLGVVLNNIDMRNPAYAEFRHYYKYGIYRTEEADT